MNIEREYYIDKKRALGYGIYFFFLMRVFTPDFISNNSSLNESYVLVSKLLTVWCVISFIYGIVQKHHCYLHEMSLILMILLYVFYLLFITFLKGGNVQRVFMVGYPIIGTVLFIHNNIRKYYYELIKGISWLFIFFAVINFIDMVFVKRVLSSGLTNFMVGGRNQLAIFLAIAFCFYFAPKLKEHRRIKFQIIDIVFIALIFSTAVLAGSVTCIITMGLFFVLFVIYEVYNNKSVLNIKLITVGYTAAWFLIIVLRMQYLFSDVITNIFHKDLTFSHRTIIWDQALETIRENPVFGHGMADSVNVFLVNHDYSGKNNDVWTSISAHNEILQLLYYGGVILILIFFLIYFVALNKRGNRNKVFYLFFIGIIAIAVNWLSEVPGEYAMFFLLAMCYYSKGINTYDNSKSQ